MKYLVIVESPSKCKKIQNILVRNFQGNTFQVIASVGHILNLPKNSIGIDMKKFEGKFQVIPGKEKIIKQIKSLSKTVDKVIVATDMDNEGEAIAFDIMNILNIPYDTKCRMLFSEITDRGITEAFNDLKTINLPRVDAQRTRRLMDRLIGFKISSITKKYFNNRSATAGRVLSITTKVIKEVIDDFKNNGVTENDSLNGIFNIHNQGITCSYSDTELKEPETILSNFKDKDFKIHFFNKERVKTYPPKPYITSSINSESPYPVSRTSSILQGLYQRGLITYIRTDSYNMSSSAKGMIKRFINENIGNDMVDSRKFHHNQPGIHECIRPTDIFKYPLNTSKLSNPQEKVIYNMIYKRSLIYMMKEEVSDIYHYKIKVDNDDNYFILKLKEIIEPGFRMYTGELDDDKELIQKICDLENVKYKKIYSNKTINRKDLLTEGRLITKLKNYGIGRPSTYSHIIENMKTKNYIKIGNVKGESLKYEQLVLEKNIIKTKVDTAKCPPQKNRLLITEMGLRVNDFLEEKFKTIMNYNYSAGLEEYLDKIQEGSISKNEVIKILFKDIKTSLDELKDFIKSLKNVSEIVLEPEQGFTEIKIKHTRYGWKIVSKIQGLSKEIYTDFDDDLKTNINEITNDDIRDFLPVIKIHNDKPLIILTGHDGGKYIKYDNKNIPLSRDIKFKSMDTFREMDINNIIKI